MQDQNLIDFQQALEQALIELDERYGYSIAAKIKVSHGEENGEAYVKHTPIIIPVKTHEVTNNASNSDMG